MRVLGYVRVSTEEQQRSGAGLMAQRKAIAGSAGVAAGSSSRSSRMPATRAKDLKRPGVQICPRRRSSGAGPDALVVAKLDRLSRSMLDFTAVMAKAQKQGWALVALDCAVDTTTPAGEAMANVLATFAQFERRLIGQRTREATGREAQAGREVRPAAVAPGRCTCAIASERKAGRSLAAIAAGLNADGVATAQGGRQWWPSTVRSSLLAVTAPS